MSRPTAIMIRAICAFLAATWCGVATILLACHAIGDIAIITGCATIFCAFAAGVEYKHAEKEYDNNNDT